MTSQDKREDHVGRRIRELRRNAGITLNAVAEQAGVSESFVSQVERGVANPSMASLTRIAAAIGTNVASLFIGEDTSAKVVRAGQGRRLAHPAGSHEEFMLTPPSAKTIQIVQAVIAPGEGSGEEPYTHAADEECVLVLSGDLTVWIDAEEHLLAAGDSLLLDPKSPHRYHNHGTEPVTSIWVMSPPVY